MYLVVLHLVLCCVFVLLQKTCRSPKGKSIVTNDQSTPIAKRTRLSSQSSRDSTTEKFRTPLDSKIYTYIFRKAPPIVERIVKFDTLGTTFIPKIFKERNWVDLLGNFQDLIEELVKEFYSNARYTGVELKCWVRGTEFSINADYIAKVLRVTRPPIWKPLHMMTEYLRLKTFFKFLELIMKLSAREPL